MSKFHFSLEKVLQWRKLELAIEEAKLKQLLDELQSAEARLNSVRDSIIGSNASVATCGDICGLDLNLMAEHRLHLTKQWQMLRHKLLEKRKLTEAQAKKHREAKQRHRLLEELRSRRHQEWQMQMAREWDELAHDSYLARWKAS